MSLIRWLIFAAVVFASAASLDAAPPALIEVQLAKESLQGKVVANSEKHFWLIGQDGRLRSMPTDSVQKYRQISPQFSSWSPAVLRDHLRREFGRPFDVVGTRHYVVCAVGEQKAKAYAETFEELLRTFQMYFSIRGFKISEPDFPLVAIVFTDFEAFSRYAKAENVTVSKDLKGYYLSTSNRISLYEPPTGQMTQNFPPSLPGELAALPFGSNQGDDNLLSPALPSAGYAWGSIEGSLKDTMIHEATHQAAFNMGLHSRIGETPKWVVEGLATVFEAPGIRNTSTSLGAKMRINRERFVWFGNYAQSRRKPKSLENFLSNDDLFKTGVLDAYSEAWAFSFFLIETRPRLYAEYLKTIASRDPLRGYSSDERLADFKQTISKEIPLLEAEFLRFIAGIK